jgi:hypothetical protein
MLTLDTAAQAQLVAPIRGVQWLAELAFTTGTLRLTTHAVDITSGGYTWTGLGQLGGVDTVREAEDGGTSDVTLSLGLGSTAMLAAATGNVETYRGQPARLYLQLIGEGYQPVGAPRQRWAGYMNRVRVERSKPTGAGQGGVGGSTSGSIKLLCSRSGANRARAGTGLRLTHVQQLLRHPGDNGCEYIQTLIDKPAVWLSKAFQQR